MSGQNDQMACIYAALILADDNVPITSDKINAILKAANYDPEPYWPGLFANALQSVEVADLIRNIGSQMKQSLAPAAPAAASNNSKPEAKANDDKAPSAKKEPPKKVEEADDDMGFGLFD